MISVRPCGSIIKTKTWCSTSVKNWCQTDTVLVCTSVVDGCIGTTMVAPVSVLGGGARARAGRWRLRPCSAAPAEAPALGRPWSSSAAFRRRRSLVATLGGGGARRWRRSAVAALLQPGPHILLFLALLLLRPCARRQRSLSAAALSNTRFCIL